MSFSATRLTCFAILSAFEEDMRDFIERSFSDMPISVALPKERAQKAMDRRASDRLPPASALPQLLPYLDFADSYEFLAANKLALDPTLSESVQSLAAKISRVTGIRNRVAHTRPMEVDDAAVLIDAADEVLKTAPVSWRSLQDTVSRLRQDPSYVLGLQINLITDPDRAPQHNLPIPDFDETGFFGRKAELHRIKKAIKGAYPVVSILGDGGIGKTSIALKVAYELLEDNTNLFDAIVWVTAKATILTPTEITRINGAIESSLGLFGRAAEELGGIGAADDPIAEVLAYMENFRILLVLDNLETVLDQRLRDFLLDLPLGSKVIVTSRIGLGIENPVQLEPLSNDDSARLLRALARVRNVQTLNRMPQETIMRLARRMVGHPAYIRWFVAGVQSGRRPEELIGSNELLLDYCMSNVYDYLSDDARAALRSMQVMPGGHTQAELAYLNNFQAAKTQATLLELLTTNFVQMANQSTGQLVGTEYRLSEFARQYLDKHHTVVQQERDWLLAKAAELASLGSQYRAESSMSPYAAETVYVHGVGDVHAARLLRDAMQLAATDPSSGLPICREAQLLAPAYYECWRVEAHLHALILDHGPAIAAFERAIELSPESPYLRYHYANYLFDQAMDLRGGLKHYETAARFDPESPELLSAIAWAHLTLGDWDLAVGACQQVLKLRKSTVGERSFACVVALRAAVAKVRVWQGVLANEGALDVLEMAAKIIDAVDPAQLEGEAFDRIMQLRIEAREVASMADGYVATKAQRYDELLEAALKKIDANGINRIIGKVKTLAADGIYGFIHADRRDYFFHYNDVLDRRDWEHFSEGTTCAFLPERFAPRGPKAHNVRWLD